MTSLLHSLSPSKVAAKRPLLLTYILLTKLFPLDFLRERLVNLLRFSVADVLSMMFLSSVTNLPLPLSYSCAFALADPHKTRKNYKLAFKTLQTAP